MNRRFRNLLILSLFVFTNAAVMADDAVNYPSGNYNHDLLITINDLSQKNKIFYSFNENDSAPDIPYRGGLLLSAISGEEREYFLNILINNELSSYTYKIDKLPPLAPKAVYSSDDASGSVYSFNVFEKSDVIVYYGYDDYKKGEVFEWNGGRIPAPKTGLIYYYAEDGSGNRSPSSVILPFEEAPGSAKSLLQVKSPVEGKFANTQLLYIEKTGFDWIKYTLNGYDPVESGSVYTEPVEIRRYGNITLRISAKPLNSDQIITKTVNYSVNTKVPLKNIPPNGIYSSGIKIEGHLSGYRYCLDDRSPGAADPYFTNDLIINPVYGGVKYTVFRLSSADKNEDFRFYYVIDDRYPANPIIDFKSRLPDENKLEVTLTGPVYSDIFYTTDGSSPGKSSQLYTGRFFIDIPENKNAGSIIIKASSLSLNGKQSNVISKIFTYDTQKPLTPDVKIDVDDETGLYRLNYSLEPDEVLYYKTEVGGRFYPADKEKFFLDIPEGSKKDFNFVFAAVDSAGNWSEQSAPLNISLDKTLPEPPLVSFENGIVTIISGYSIDYKYEITQNGRVVSDGGNKYIQPFDLSAEAVANSTLLLSVKSTDQLGNVLNTSYKFFSNEETEKEAVLFSRKSQDIYSGSETAFMAYPDGINDKLYYYLTEYGDDGSMITEGPYETDGYIRVSGRENIKKDYKLEIYSVNQSTQIKSKISTYQFTVDNEIPEIPQISGLKNGVTVSDRVVLSSVHDDDSVVFLNYSDTPDGLGALFSNSSIIFNKPLIFDVEDGTEKDFYIIIGAGDSAGNSVKNDELFHFVIDKKAPSLEDVNFEVRGVADNSPLNLTIRSKEDLRFYYEYGIRGSKIKEPSLESGYFTDSFKFSGIPGKDQTYIMKIIASDEAGNTTPYPLTFMFRVDNKKPAKPVVPDLIVNDKNKKILTYWKNPTDTLFYKIIYNGIETGNEQWTVYNNPFSAKYTSETRQVEYIFYAADKAGNKSEINRSVVLLPATINTELVQGITNNTFNKSDLELRALKADRIIRYEISTDQVLPSKVSVFSPELPDVLPFRVEEGESLNFIVSLKEFRDADDKKGGAEQVLRFTIDKQIPEPPEIDGIKNGEYYLTDCTAYFKSGADAIFYNVTDSLDTEKEYIKYTDRFSINTPDGTYKSFIINAYSQDFSGNKSAVKSWEITIDKEIIYVSDDGKDYYEGTRSKPFKSINKALEQVKLSDRKTLFIEEGRYELNSPGVINENVTIYGGFRKGSWIDRTGKTEITVNKNFPDDNPAFYIYGGNLTIENIYLNAGSGFTNTVFLVNKGNLNISNSVVNTENTGNSAFIKQNYGKLVMNNVDISAVSTAPSFIKTEYGVVNINNSTVKVQTKSTEGIILLGENCTDYSISSSEILLTGGQSATALSFKNSDVKLKSDTVTISGCSESSTAVESVDSRIAVNYCKIEALESNRISRAFVSEDSILDINGNSIRLDAVAGIIGFTLTGGTSVHLNNKIITENCNDFSYLYLLNNGKHSVETNLITLGKTDESVSIRTKGSELEFFNNTLISYGGKNKTILVAAQKNSVNRIINNILINKKGSGTVMFVQEGQTASSFKNNCSWGWSAYLSGSEQAVDVVSLDLADGIYSAGRFSGNIEESPEETFSEPQSYQLSKESKCIDAGYDLKNILKKAVDFDGDARPNAVINRTSSFDIGADEFYQ